MDELAIDYKKLLHNKICQRKAFQLSRRKDNQKYSAGYRNRLQRDMAHKPG